MRNYRRISTMGSLLSSSSGRFNLRIPNHPKLEYENDPQSIARLHGAFPAPAVSSPRPASRLHSQPPNYSTATSPRNVGGIQPEPKDARRTLHQARVARSGHHHDQGRFTPLPPRHELLVGDDSYIAGRPGPAAFPGHNPRFRGRDQFQRPSRHRLLQV